MQDIEAASALGNVLVTSAHASSLTANVIQMFAIAAVHLILLGLRHQCLKSDATTVRSNEALERK